ncbi:hypothetical protein E2C01_021553 [Portunus trituberculatus]|uniref:Uncharacterized protein n=1 Tax=Portunus trituberculatus TaxID=210409 RepID=A0A5B7E2W8_PORTR|nr:hypothetical protein [Portunus trituberculatus]
MEVARLHVYDSALTQLCTWDYEVEKDALLSFDVVRKKKNVRFTKRRPSFRPHNKTGSQEALVSEGKP